MPFELQPCLKGDLLELRPLRPEDFDELYAVASDPLIWEQHPCPDRCKEDVFRVFFREALESGGAFRVIDNKDGHTIGSSRFHGYDEKQSQIGIGWTFLARSHWGGAYNRQLKQLMLGHAFRFVKSVIFVVGPQNIRSQRALGKNRSGSRGDKARRQWPGKLGLSNRGRAVARTNVNVSLTPQLAKLWSILRRVRHLRPMVTLAHFE